MSSTALPISASTALPAGKRELSLAKGMLSDADLAERLQWEDSLASTTEENDAMEAGSGPDIVSNQAEQASPWPPPRHT